MEINAYEQYFKARAVFSDVKRKAALVMLTADTQAGNITYKAAVTFFPYADEEDYAVSYDAYFEQVLYQGKGRRSKQKEAAYMERLREIIDGIARENDASVLWDQPLKDARSG